MVKQDSRLIELLEHIHNLASSNFSKRAIVNGDGSKEDELALGINKLTDVWQDSILAMKMQAKERDQELVRLFQQLSNSEKQYLNMVDKSPVGIMLVEPNSGAIVDANQVLLNILGYSLTELMPLNINDLIPEHRITEREEYLDKLTELDKVTFETEYIHKDGYLILVETTLNMNMYGDALPVVMAVVTDIRERRKAKELLLSAIMSAEDSERERISSEIHDGLQQTLICASLQLEQIKAENGEKLAKDSEFDKGLYFLNEAIEESRKVARALLPKTVEDNGLLASLNELVSRINLLSKVNISLKCKIDESFMDTSIALRLYHIVQEAINNGLKHSHASSIHISITEINNNIVLEIIDNGIGFDSNSHATNNSFGLRSMQQKTKAMLGDFKIDSVPGNGTKIKVEVPIN